MTHTSKTDALLKLLDNGNTTPDAATSNESVREELGSERAGNSILLHIPNDTSHLNHIESNINETTTTRRTTTLGRQNNASHADVEATKLKSYHWLSKSSKRRVRKGMQKKKLELSKGENMATEEDEILGSEEESESNTEAIEEGVNNSRKGPSSERTVPKRLAQWRKRKLERKTDPFSLCYGTWHHFACGHRISVLCLGCDWNWRTGNSGPCVRYIAVQRAIISSTRDRGKVGGRNCHFDMPCPDCRQRGGEVDLSYKMPWSGNQPRWVWKVAEFVPAYLARSAFPPEGMDEMRYFYIVSSEKSLVVQS
jgi:hypothetical protein